MPEPEARLIAPLTSFTLDPENARKHDDENIRAIADSLAQFKQQIPIVVDSGGVIRKGNGTYKAAQLLEWTNIWYVRTELDAIQAAAFALADNRTAELSDWDYEMLRDTLDKLTAEGVEIKQLGWNDYDLNAILTMVDDDIPPPTLDELAEQYNQLADDELWPLIKLRVPQEVYARYAALMRAQTNSADDAAKFERLISICEASIPA